MFAHVFVRTDAATVVMVAAMALVGFVRLVDQPEAWVTARRALDYIIRRRRKD